MQSKRPRDIEGRSVCVTGLRNRVAATECGLFYDVLPCPFRVRAAWLADFNRRVPQGLAPNILRGMSMNVGMMACYDQAKSTMMAVRHGERGRHVTFGVDDGARSWCPRSARWG